MRGHSIARARCPSPPTAYQWPVEGRSDAATYPRIPPLEVLTAGANSNRQPAGFMRQSARYPLPLASCQWPWDRYVCVPGGRISVKVTGFRHILPVASGQLRGALTGERQRVQLNSVVRNLRGQNPPSNGPNRRDDVLRIDRQRV